MITAKEHKTGLDFTRKQLESLSGKSYDRLKAEAKENRIEIEKFIHQYEVGPDRLMSFLVDK